MSSKKNDDPPGQLIGLPPRSDPSSPWAHMAEALAEGCRANAARDIELGLAFDGVQQESYRSWDAWDRELDEEAAAANDNGAPPDEEASRN